MSNLESSKARIDAIITEIAAIQQMLPLDLRIDRADKEAGQIVMAVIDKVAAKIGGPGG